MPVQYSDMGALASHQHTRTNCSLFDVSHMLQTRVWGSDRLAFMESLTVLDMMTMKENTGSLTVFTNENGRKLKLKVVCCYISICFRWNH